MIRVGRKVGGTVSRSKMVDLDGLRVCDMPINSVTYLLLNRPQQDPPIFAYSHIIKRQLVVQVCILYVGGVQKIRTTLPRTVVFQYIYASLLFVLLRLYRCFN